MFSAQRVPTNDMADQIGRLRAVLMRVDLDCTSRQSLSEALDRFTALEQRRVTRRRLAQARDLKDRIVAILAFLSELDQVTESESDRTVFEEIALLFVEIANCANAGATALRAIDRQAGTTRPGDRPKSSGSVPRAPGYGGAF